MESVTQVYEAESSCSVGCLSVALTCCCLKVDTVNSECEKLKQANSELQRQRDNLEDEKEDVNKDKERQIKENQRWYVHD